MKIDSHQHFWKPERGDYGWLTPDLDKLYRDFLPADLKPMLDRHGIDRSILVQAAPTEEETHFMLGLAAENEFIAGVVGWTDFESPVVGENIARLSENDLLVGLRPMVQDIADDEWLANPRLAPAFEAMVETDLVFDALLFPQHLKRLVPVLERHPKLTVVIDHAAKPDLKNGVTRDWFADMKRAATFPQVSCKLSGLATEAKPDWSTGDFIPIMDHLLQCFGPDRILWGSDWPVLTLAGSYDKWWSSTQELLASLSEADRANILGGNAERVYLGA